MLQLFQDLSIAIASPKGLQLVNTSLKLTSPHASVEVDSKTFNEIFS
jgi:hypothetical protein